MRYGAVLAQHHASTRAASADQHGHEVSTEGAASFVALARASDAVAAAYEEGRTLSLAAAIDLALEDTVMRCVDSLTHGHKS